MYAVEMKNITKVFGTFKANDNITLQVKPNTIHALIGENGAGKSTLMSILFGLYKPTSGQIYINDHIANIDSPLKANLLGIGMVHQHFKLVEDFTVLENIVLNDEDTIAGVFLDYSLARKKVKQLMEKYNFKIDLNKKIYNCSVAEQQRTEILKMLYRDSEILIFDEPTAVLSPQQIDKFLDALIDLKSKGKTIILITHKLDELKKVADTGTVIRLGKFVANVDIKTITHKELSTLMVGEEIKEINKTFKEVNDDVIFEIENLNVYKKGYKNVLGLKNFSLGIKAGEIVGIAGVEGNGQSELINAISGLSSIKSGVINFMVDKRNNVHMRFLDSINLIKNKIKTDRDYPITLNELNKILKENNAKKFDYDDSLIEEYKNNFYLHLDEIKNNINLRNNLVKMVENYHKFYLAAKNSNHYVLKENAKKYEKTLLKHKVKDKDENRFWIRLDKMNIASKYLSGMAHIPEDRHRHGVVLDLNLSENGVSQIISDYPFSKKKIINYNEINKFSQKIIDNFDVRSSNGIKSIARGLSGGNQQKFIVGRELSKPSELIIISQPTRGLDVGAINIIHRYIIDAKTQNKAILLISYEIDEIIALADRVVVLNSGTNQGMITGSEITRNKLGELMARKVD
ncbi:ABC transporter ATP-binding protein [Mycoplasma elephantis]|uniref:ABC transporter ATP-binding protein n=1 Tax=Mycoplasma elephantis TaxID=114882 RepID=UPI00056287A0|nr:ABC transporter ATP-binding protein [Mycoplasma elephantis]